MYIVAADDVGRRPTQEDRQIIHEDEHGVLLAIADGANGEKTVDIVAENLVKAFNRYRSQLGVGHAIIPTFKILQRITREKTSGTTLTMLWIRKPWGPAFIATMGDSLAIITGKEPSDTFVAPRHTIESNPFEKEEARKRGARFVGGSLCFSPGELALPFSRALGFKALGSVLNRKPEICIVPLYEGSSILIASDGILDPSPRQTEIEIIRMGGMLRMGASPWDLLQDAQTRRQSTDNMSVIIARAA